MGQIKFKNDDIELDVNFSSEENTVWLSKDDMAILFKKDRSVIGKYARSMIKNGDVNASVWAKFAHTESFNNSPSSNIFFICLPITLLSLSNKIAIWSMLNQIFSFCRFTSILTNPSSVS